MVRKPDIQYVTQFYSYGSEAKVLELKPVAKKHKFTLPKVIPQNKIAVHVDVAACAGIAVAIVMVVLMALRVSSYLKTCAQFNLMTDYVISLQNKNVEKQQEYVKLYDLEDIQEKAVAMGMIPREEAEVITIHPVYPEPEMEEPWWTEIAWFLKGLFA